MKLIGMLPCPHSMHVMQDLVFGGDVSYGHVTNPLLSPTKDGGLTLVVWVSLEFMMTNRFGCF